jgi:2-keto-4-pentenoate hydratase
MTYSLNQEAKAFSYTPEELFDCITRIVAHPHKTITEHDQSRAMAIFLTFSDYLDNYTESDNSGGFCVYESDNTDFEGYVMGLMNEELHGYLKADEVLK